MKTEKIKIENYCILHMAGSEKNMEKCRFRPEDAVGERTIVKNMFLHDCFGRAAASTVFEILPAVKLNYALKKSGNYISKRQWKEMNLYANKEKLGISSERIEKILKKNPAIMQMESRTN